MKVRWTGKIFKSKLEFLLLFIFLYTIGRLMFLNPIKTVKFLVLFLFFIYRYTLFVRLFESNQRHNDWTNQHQIRCGTSKDHKEGVWMIKIKNQPPTNSISIKFYKTAKFFVFVLQCTPREAPWKPSIIKSENAQKNC